MPLPELTPEQRAEYGRRAVAARQRRAEWRSGLAARIGSGLSKTMREMADGFTR